MYGWCNILFDLKAELEIVSKQLEVEYTNEIYEKFERVEEAFRNRDGYAFEYNASKIFD